MKMGDLKKGISIIEIIIAAAIITISVTVTINVFQTFIQLSRINTAQNQAALLAEETSEALQIIRDNGWATVSAYTTDTDYYLYWDGSTYSLTTTPQTNDGYTRIIEFSTVERDDGTGNIVASGTLDENTLLYGISIYSNDDLATPILYTEGLIHNVYE